VNAYTLGGQHGLWRQAERVLAPTLLIYGRRDQLVGYRMAQRAARAFRDSRLLSLPDAGHVAMMEDPETVATAFRELLADAGELGKSALARAATGADAVSGRRAVEADGFGRAGRGAARGVRDGGSVSTVGDGGGAAAGAGAGSGTGSDGKADDTNAGS
jgi:hypothetical protein